MKPILWYIKEIVNIIKNTFIVKTSQRLKNIYSSMDFFQIIFHFLKTFLHFQIHVQQTSILAVIITINCYDEFFCNLYLELTLNLLQENFMLSIHIFSFYPITALTQTLIYNEIYYY